MKASAGQENLDPTLVILVPFFNEEHSLAACLGAIEYAEEGIQNGITSSAPEYTVLLCDSGSTDRSADIANTFVAKHSHWKLSNSGQVESLPHLLAQVFNASVQWHWIISSDIVVSRPAFAWAMDQISAVSTDNSEPRCSFVFQKTYSCTSLRYRIYAWVLNHVLLGQLKTLVWTNAPILTRNSLTELLSKAEGFLDDLRLSGILRHEGFALRTSPFKVLVNSRRYEGTGFWSQLWRNVRVLWGYYVQKKPSYELKKLYLTGAKKI
ncbi:MAG: glycosyltransferase [Bdellovibrionota bacterium]